MSPRLEFALRAAVLAGKSTLAHFCADTEVQLKADDTPVTRADREAEALLRKQIASAYPGEAILGEEEGQSGSGDDRWVLDPIDGTKSFVCGVPLYATLVAFERGGEPELGAVYFPALDELIYAEKGSGAFWNGRPCRVKARSEARGAVLCTGSHAGLEKRGRLEGVLSLAREAMATRSWCDAYGHMLVATGRADAMIDPVVSRWDISAPSLVVREAGGKFTDFRGGDVLGDEAISATPGIHPALLEAFR